MPDYETIQKIRMEAFVHGDYDQVVLCDDALNGNPESQAKVEKSLFFVCTTNRDPSDDFDWVSWSKYALAGDYLVRFVDEPDPPSRFSDIMLEAIQAQLRLRGLWLITDDRGLLVVSVIR